MPRQDTAGARGRSIPGYGGEQPSDPARAAEAILKAVEPSIPPFHPVPGIIGIGAAREKFERSQKDLNSWEQASPNTDCPENGAVW